MAPRHLVWVEAALVLLGGVIAGAWLYVTGIAALGETLGSIRVLYTPPLLLVTAFCLFVRFVRWQFLLRRVGVRLPTRASLSVFLASLVGIATPAYVGELIRGVLARRRFGVAIRATTALLIGERLLDVAALAALTAIAADRFGLRVAMALLVGATVVLGRAAVALARRVGVPETVPAAFADRRVLLPAFGLSLLAWLPTGLLVTLAAASLDVDVPLGVGLRVFASATLVGGLTLMPAGVGSTGSLQILELQGFGLSLGTAVIVVTLVRLASTGVSLALGMVFLLRELASRHAARAESEALRFERLAGHYRQQFSTHVWTRLLDRRITLLTTALSAVTRPSALGLDLGCGLGHHGRALGEHGYRVVGVDAAHGLVREARLAGMPALTADAAALPFRDAAFDFVYTVGVLHHLPRDGGQDVACREVSRVLRPGGLFVVHETNPKNPLFRFYMGYVFPILKLIDAGTEWWVEPGRWTALTGLKLLDVSYFTFLPDFVPRLLLRPLGAVERRLEASAARGYSAHYMAILKKDPA